MPACSGFGSDDLDEAPALFLLKTEADEEDFLLRLIGSDEDDELERDLLATLLLELDPEELDDCFLSLLLVEIFLSCIFLCSLSSFSSSACKFSPSQSLESDEDEEDYLPSRFLLESIVDRL